MICTDDLEMASSNLYDDTVTSPICKHSIESYEHGNTSMIPNTRSGLGGVTTPGYTVAAIMNTHTRAAKKCTYMHARL